MRDQYSSDQSKMDDTTDPLNLLEQKVIRPLTEHSCKRLTSRDRKDRPSAAAFEDTQYTVQLEPANNNDPFVSFHIEMCLQIYYISLN